MKNYRFRVFDLEQQSYLYPYGNNYGATKFYYQNGQNPLCDVAWFMDCERFENPQRFLVEQWTGLHFINQEPAYEGDTFDWAEEEVKIIYDTNHAAFMGYWNNGDMAHLYEFDGVFK